jgi:hypothetical protein
MSLLGLLLASDYTVREQTGSAFLASSPDGTRFSVDDMQTGSSSIRDRQGRVLMHLPSGMTTAPFAVATPWIDSGKTLLAAKHTKRGGDSLCIVDVPTHNVRTAILRGTLAGAPATASRDGNIVVAGYSSAYQVQPSLIVWRTYEDNATRLFAVPFRLSVEAVSWRDQDRLIVITRGKDLDPAVSRTREEWVEIDVHSLYSRILYSGSGSITHWVSPRPDQKGRTFALRATGKTAGLCYISPGESVVRSANKLPAGNGQWNAVQASTSRIMLWRSAGTSEMQAVWYDCASDTLGKILTLSAQGPITADANGLIWAKSGSAFRALHATPPVEKIVIGYSR